MTPPRPATSERRTWLGHMLILLTITATLSLRQYVRTASVTEDSVGFIHFARQLLGEIPEADREFKPRPRGPWTRGVLQRLHTVLPTLAVVERKEQHPGYPLALLAVRQLLGANLAGDAVLQWTRAGQVVSLLAGCVLTLALYSLGRLLAGPTPAFVAAALLAALPYWVNARADALSDIPALTLLVLATRYAVRLVEAGSGRHAFLCGTFAALGYLVRPEAAQAALVAGAVLAVQLVRRPGDYRRLLKLGFLLLVPLVLVCVPYIFLRGALLTKQARVFTADADAPQHRIGGVLLARTPQTDQEANDGGQEACEPEDAFASSRKAKVVRWILELVPPPLLILAAGVKKLFVEWSRSLGGPFLVPVLLGLLNARRQFRHKPGHALLAGIALFNLILLPGVLYYKKGYLDTRHVLPLAALTSFWCWPGLVRLGKWLVAPQAWLTPLAAHVAAGLLALGLGLTLPTTLSAPLHGERNGYRLAGEWLRGKVPADSCLFDPESLASFYAAADERRYWDYAHPPLTARYLEQMIRLHAPAFVVVSDRYLRDHGCTAGLPHHTHGCRLLPVCDFPASLDPHFSARIRLFQVVQSAR